MKKHLTLSLCIAVIALQATGQSANRTLSNLTSPTAVNVNLLPETANSKNLGSSTQAWKNSYVDGRSYLKTAFTYFDDSTSQFRVNNGGDRFVIDDAGRIGIGTLSPVRKLDIQTTGLTTVMKVEKPWTGTGSTNFNLVEISNAYNFGYGTGLYSSGGQIGVKGYAPNGGVTGYGVYGQAYGAAGNSYGVYGTASTTAATAFGVYGTASGPNAWAGYFSGKGYFTGNVGVGTTIPSVKLHVNGGTDAEPGSGGYFVTGSVSSTNIAMDNNEIMARNNGAVSTLYFNNDGGDLAMCVASGNVMIGTTTPATGYILSVDGKGMFEEVKVQLSSNWPDYVFDKNYKLPSLYALESSIKAKKHLPGIPSAAEVKKEGILVGDMQTKMMEKIEELTLYIISLQKQIDELKNQQN
jgi:hypothetical protein